MDTFKLVKYSIKYHCIHGTKNIFLNTTGALIPFPPYSSIMLVVFQNEMSFVKFVHYCLIGESN